MKVSLDLHDFSVVNNRLELLLKLKDRFPGFKVSLFCVPHDAKADWGASLIRNQYLAEIKKHLDWLQLIPHGLYHKGYEMSKCSYAKFRNNIVPQIHSAFVGDGLPYVKGFCAPHWKWNGEVVRALDDLGWWGAVNPNDPKMQRTKKYYEYSHAIDEDLPHNLDVLNLHGHLFGTRNDLANCLDKILMLPKTAEWHFITDFLKEGE